jgi:hypothetical protein
VKQSLTQNPSKDRGPQLDLLQNARSLFARSFQCKTYKSCAPSSSIIAALFLIETAKNQLEEAGSPQAEVVSKASDILTETTEKIAKVLGDGDQSPTDS